MLVLEGGPNGGNGLPDIDVRVGVVIAEALLLPPQELRADFELTDEGLEHFPEVEPELEPDLTTS